MAQTVVGTFNRRQEAERAAEKLHDAGFSENEVSIVSKDENRQNQDRNARETDSVGNGAAWGSGIGAAAGLAAGAGLLMVPGIGPLLAMGPIAAGLMGAAGGGLAGTLMDWGIPKDVGDRYEQAVKQGRTICAVHSKDHHVDDAAEILRQEGAQDVSVH
ncbi:MAG: general stress protein [Firmicutes bacterium]|nr:general stress protein [Bacillota bacterium]